MTELFILFAVILASGFAMWKGAAKENNKVVVISSTVFMIACAVACSVQ